MTLIVSQRDGSREIRDVPIWRATHSRTLQSGVHNSSVASDQLNLHSKTSNSTASLSTANMSPAKRTLCGLLTGSRRHGSKDTVIRPLTTTNH